MNKNLNIVYLTKSDLGVALKNNTYWNNTVVAMPKSKAQWILKNDRIEPEDHVAVIGLEKDKIIAYTLIVPDLIKVGNTHEKVNWIHIWWVNQKYSGSIIGTYIFNKTIRVLNKNVILNSYIENTNEFFNKGPFTTIKARPRFTIFFKLDHSILVSKLSVLKHFKWLVALANNTIVRLYNQLNKNKIKNATKNLTYDYLNILDDETWQLIEKKTKNDFTVKTRDYVNWLIDNTQYTQTPISNKFLHSYSTTGYSKNIYSNTVKVIYNNSLIGVLSYVINGIEFNLKLFITKDANLTKLCVGALLEHFFKSGATYIITDDAMVAELINKHYRPIFTYKKEKKAIAHKSLNFNFNKVLVTDRDGRFH